MRRFFTALMLILPWMACGSDTATSGVFSSTSAEACGDGTDNDGDGLLDCADPDCTDEPSCLSANEDCQNGEDDDGDGLADCLDTDCLDTLACIGDFQLEAHTSLTPQNTLTLQTNLPARVADCLAESTKGIPCDDVDQDTLTDAWEDLVLSRFQPLSRFDEEESLIGASNFVVANVGRVALVKDDPLEVHVFIMLGYSKDFGSCGFTAHNGDSERVALALQADGSGLGNVEMIGAYTAAHEGTTTDHGRVFVGAELTSQLRFTDDPETKEPRWLVYPSANKHATYANIDICEGISVIPCFDEDCAPDGVTDASLYDRLPNVYNAGEEQYPRLTSLAEIGFPGDDAWANQDFCGGLGGSGCSSAVREKLLNDPF